MKKILAMFLLMPLMASAQFISLFNKNVSLKDIKSRTIKRFSESLEVENGEYFKSKNK